MNDKLEKNPLVSIVMPTHNRSDMLQRAIKSLQEQTYKNIEILVCNDGSSDDTENVLKNYNDNRIVVLKNEKPQGACVARNMGIFAAKGEFITFLDDDDEFFPTRIEKMVDIWDDKFSFIATDYLYLKKSGGEKHSPNRIETLNTLLYRQSVGIMILTTKKRLLSIGGFDENLYSSQDYDLVIRLVLMYGNAFTLNEVLYIVHTEHEKPRITSSTKKVRGHFDFYRKHKKIMNIEQRKSKLFELFRYKNKKISVLKAIYFGKSKSKLDILKYIIKSRIK